MKNLKDSKLILNESEVIPMIISLVPFRTFRGPLFPKPVTGQELFLAVPYRKPALNAYVVLCAACTKNRERYLVGLLLV